MTDYPRLRASILKLKPPTDLARGGIIIPVCQVVQEGWLQIQI